MFFCCAICDIAKRRAYRMSSGRDMIAVMDSEFVYNRLQCSFYRLEICELPALRLCEASVICR
jgi:hypothetical protein